MDFPVMLSHWRPPHPSLGASVAVPVKDEATRLPALVAAFAAQVDEDGQPLARGRYEILLLLNNCTDESASVARTLAACHPDLALQIAEARLPPAIAHVGTARRWLMDQAADRLLGLGRMQGVVLTTDADTVPAPDWIAKTLVLCTGPGAVDGVGGDIRLQPEEHAALPACLHRAIAQDIRYRRAIEALADLIAPDAADPLPRHHHHTGASLAVTAVMYRAVGGLPPFRCGEDVALYRRIRAAGGRFRHSPDVRVYTSVRLDGRAAGGMADTLRRWRIELEAGRPLLVPSAEAVERCLRLGLDDRSLDTDDLDTIEAAISGLEQRVHRLRHPLRRTVWAHEPGAAGLVLA